MVYETVELRGYQRSLYYRLCRRPARSIIRTSTPMAMRATRVDGLTSSRSIIRTSTPMATRATRVDGLTSSRSIIRTSTPMATRATRVDGLTPSRSIIRTSTPMAMRATRVGGLTPFWSIIRTSTPMATRATRADGLTPMRDELWSSCNLQIIWVFPLRHLGRITKDEFWMTKVPIKVMAKVTAGKKKVPICDMEASEKYPNSLKVKFRQYPAIHTNYSLSNCTISN